MRIDVLPADRTGDAVALWQASGLTRPWNDPDADLVRALAGPTSTVLGAQDIDGCLLGTAMVGHDGHRGWVYYLAVQPELRRGRVLIGCCSCGETGCGSLALRLRRLQSVVLWEPDDASQYESLSRTYSFGLTQYLDAVDDAAGDRPGEGRGSRVAREVRLMLGLYDQSYDSLTIFQSVKLDWISAWPWDSDLVRVSLTDATGQDVLEFVAAPGETDRAFAVRIATQINERRYERHGDDG